MNEAQRKYISFCAIQKDSIRTSFDKIGISYTENRVEERLIRLHEKEYLQLRKDMEDRRTDYETVNSLCMAMMQRKDLIKEAIDFLKVSKDKEGCILTNRAFMKKLEKLIGQ